MNSIKFKPTNNDPNYCFENFYTGDSNIEAHTIAKRIALNSFQNNNIPIVLYASSGNGKNHLVKSILNLKQQNCLYENIRVVNCSEVFDTSNNFLENKSGLVILQHGQRLANEPQYQIDLIKFIEVFNFKTGNILITTDTPIKSVFNLSLAYNEIVIGKPTYDLKGKILRNKMQPEYLLEITESEVTKALSINVDSIRQFENILYVIEYFKRVENIPYFKAIDRVISKGNY